MLIGFGTLSTAYNNYNSMENYITITFIVKSQQHYTFNLSRIVKRHFQTLTNCNLIEFDVLFVRQRAVLGSCIKAFISKGLNVIRGDELQ